MQCLQESVRNGKNKRQAEEDESAPTQGSYGSSQSGGGYDKKQGQGQYGGKTNTLPLPDLILTYNSIFWWLW